MSFRRALALVAGSVAVHLAVVACGSADGPIFGQADPDAGAAGAGGGAEPIVAVEACDHVGPGGIPTYFASHSFEGKTVEQLGRVVAVAKYRLKGPLDGYDATSVAVLLKDGSVAVECGHEGSLLFDSVTFILQ